jgi:NADPH:quinone reductase-like Zn-dependent oxidoreductase
LIIPHSDGAGDAVMAPATSTRAGVSNWIGERVGIGNGQWKRTRGSAARYIVRPSAQSVRLLPNASYVEGASLGLPETTAVQAVRFAKIGLCSKVLITGAVAKIGATTPEAQRADKRAVKM